MSFFNELKRRNVIRVGIAYVIVAWLVLQFADVVLNNIQAPDWVFQVIMLMLGIGFPVVLIFAWAFEMTPEGIKKEKDVDRNQSITPRTGRKLDYAIFTVMAVALVYFVWESRFQDAINSEPDARPRPGSHSVTSGEAVIEQDNSIAVLPFANRSDEKNDLFFTDGIHDDLLTQLAKVSGLKVISRTSVMEYRDTTKKIPEIAAELGVSKILEGGIQRAGDRIRINAQLIDVSTDEHLWAETFDREMTVENLFDIQSEITRAIVAAVKGEMSTVDAENSHAAPTSNLQAYEAYMHARAATKEPDYVIEKYLRAQKWAEQAVALDPDFAWAWSILVEVHGNVIWIGYDESNKRFTAAKTALDRVMAINPESGEAQAALGEYRYRIEGDFPGALEAFQKAAERQPGNADIKFQLALTQRRLATFDDAIKSYKSAVELDPGNSAAVADYIHTLMIIKDWEQALALLDQGIERFPDASILHGYKANVLIQSQGDLAGARQELSKMTPNAGDVYFWLATLIPIYERDLDAALAIWETPAVTTYAGYGGESKGARGINLGKIYQLLGEHSLATKHFQLARFSIEASLASGRQIATIHRAHEIINLATAYALMGDSEAALETLHKALAIARAGTDRYEGAAIEGRGIYVLALSGQRDKALKELERLIDVPGSYLSRWEIYLDPSWDFIRDDERFNELVRPLNLQETGS